MPSLKNHRHEAFAKALANGESAAAAYVTAGYKPNRGNAATLKRRQSVSRRVAEIIGAREERERGANQKALAKAEVTAAKVISELAIAAFSDIGEVLDFTGEHSVRLRRPCDISATARRAISSIKVKRYLEGHGEEAKEVEVTEFKLWDKGAALTQLGRHLGLFIDRHQVTVDQLDKILEAATDALRKRLPPDQAKEAVVELVRVAKDTYGQKPGEGRAA